MRQSQSRIRIKSLSRQKCVLVAAVAWGVLGASSGPVSADTGQERTTARGGALFSPGLPAGNAVPAPVRLPGHGCGNTADVIGLVTSVMGVACGHGVSRAPIAQRALDARTPGAGWRPGDGRPGEGRSGDGRPGKERVPDTGRGPDGGREPDVGRRAAHSVRAPRVGAVARAGALAGSALLASTGAEQVGVAAGVGGGLVLGGALLVRWSRRR